MGRKGLLLVVSVITVLALFSGCVGKGEPQTASDWLARGDELRARGELTGAIAAYERALEIEPESALAHLKLGRAYRETEGFDQSVGHYLRCMELDPGLPAAYYELGILLAEQETDPLLAASCLAKGSELDANITSYIPDSDDLALTYINKGVSLAEAEAYPLALGYLELAKLLDPSLALARKNLAVAYNNFGLFLGRNGDVAGAEENFERALAADPNLKEAHNNLGIAYGLRDNIGGAITEFEKAIATDPGFVDALNNMGVALAAQTKFAQAKSYLEQALSLASQDSVYADRIPRIRKNLEAVEEALAGEAIDISAIFSFDGYFGLPTVGLDLGSFVSVNQRQIEETMTSYHRTRECQEGMSRLECQLRCSAICAYNASSGCWECPAGALELVRAGVVTSYDYTGLLFLQIGEEKQIKKVDGEMTLRFIFQTEDAARVVMEWASARARLDLDGDGIYEGLELSASGEGILDLRSGHIELVNAVEGSVEISSAAVQRFSLSFPETGFYHFDTGVIYLTSSIFQYDLTPLGRVAICFSKAAEEKGLKILDQKNKDKLSAEWEKEHEDWEKAALAIGSLAKECEPGQHVTAAECVIKVTPVEMELLPIGCDTFGEHAKHKHVMKAGEDIMRALGWVIFASDIGSAVSKGKLFKIGTPQAGEAVEFIWKAFKNYLQVFHRELWVTYEVEVYHRYTRFGCRDGQWVAELVWREPEEKWTKARYLTHVAGSSDLLLGLTGEKKIEEATKLCGDRAEELARKLHEGIAKACPKVTLPEEVLVQNVLHAKKLASK